MAKRVFVSFRYADKDLRNDLLQFFQEHGGPVQATPAVMRTDVGDQGDERVKQVIREQLQGCVAVLAVVGDTVHNSRWIEYELGVANEFGIPKFQIRHPKATGGPPNAHAGMREIEWKRDAVAAVINPL